MAKFFMENRDPCAQDEQPAQSGFNLKLGRNETELGFSQNMKVVDLLKS